MRLVAMCRQKVVHGIRSLDLLLERLNQGGHNDSNWQADNLPNARKSRHFIEALNVASGSTAVIAVQLGDRRVPAADLVDLVLFAWPKVSARSDRLDLHCFA